MVGKANQTLLIEKLSEKLKKDIKRPDWALFVKTSAGKERPPEDNRWWYLRTASVLRKIYLKGPIGVSKLSTLYSAKKNLGHKPERTYPGSTHIIRTILQQLEKEGLVAQGNRGVHKGRIPTAKAISLIQKTENELVKEEPKKPAGQKKKPEEAKEDKPAQATTKTEKKEAKPASKNEEPSREAKKATKK